MFNRQNRDSTATEQIGAPLFENDGASTVTVASFLWELLYWPILAMIFVAYVVINNWIVIGHGKTHEIFVTASPENVCHFLRNSEGFNSQHSKRIAGVATINTRPILEQSIHGKCTGEQISLNEELLMGEIGKAYKPADVEPVDHFKDGMLYVGTGGWYLTPDYIGGKLYRFENSYQLTSENGGTKVTYRSALCHEKWTAGRMPFIRSEECWAMWDMSLFGFMAPFLHKDIDMRMQNVLQHIRRNVRR
ncbi:MAG: hypothetical protein ACR2O3_10185 [Rhizobiaceae bacterium]